MFFMRRAFSRAKGRSSSKSLSSQGSCCSIKGRSGRSGSGCGAMGLRLSTSTESSLMDEFNLAVIENDYKKVEELVDDVSDIDHVSKEHDYTTALGAAMEKGYNDIAELLLDHGASPNYKNGCAPLNIACEHRNKDLAQLVLNFGADVNFDGGCGVSALVLAARQGDLEIVRLLLDYGANINQTTKWECLPLGVRWSMDYPDVPEEVCADLCEPFRENTVLMAACREGHLMVVSELLSYPVNIHATNTVKNTALHIAAQSESQMIAYSNEPCRSPIHPPEIVMELLNHGANVAALNMFDETPLDRIVKYLKFFAENHAGLQRLTNDYMSYSLLLKAGSPFPSKFLENPDNRKGIFPLLLGPYKRVQSKDLNDKMCCKAYVEAVKVTVLTGIRPDQETILSIKAELKTSRTKRDLVEFLEGINSDGYSLKQLCRIRLRQVLPSPLLSTAMSENIVFPSLLRQYILMEYL